MAVSGRKKSWGSTKPSCGVTLDSGDPISMGLVGYWLFNEGGGNKAFDVSGRNNTGTLTNGPVWKPGKFGTALRFDGSNDRVSITDSALFSPGSGDLTISAWALIANNDTGSPQAIYSNVGGDGIQSINLQTTTGSNTKIKLAILDSSFRSLSASSIATMDIGVWFHVVAVKIGTSASLYINGILNDTQSNASLAAINTFDATNLPAIGLTNSGGNPWKGLIDNVRIYNRALSASEVRRLYEEPFAGIIAPRRRSYSSSSGSLARLRISNSTKLTVGVGARA